MNENLIFENTTFALEPTEQKLSGSVEGCWRPHTSQGGPKPCR